MIRQKILNILPSPDYRAKMITGWQNTSDIISAINQQHKINLPQAAQIKHLFDGGNEKKTAQNIHRFLRNEIQYRVEPGQKQTTKSLSRFIADGYGDCKHFSIFTNTILDACGYKPCYRYAGYSSGKGLVHVYTYLPKSDTICDAVLPGFDTEKTPLIKKDIPMSLYRLSGIDEIGAINFNKIKSNVAKASAKASNVVAKAVKEIPNATKKLADGGKTLSLAVPRNAFLGLVKLNVSGLATSLKSLIDKKGPSGLQFWDTLGGDSKSLQNAIQDGATKKRIMGPVEETAAFNEIYGGYSGDGVYIGEPVTIAASLASAAPILIKVKDILSKAGIKPDDLAKIQSATKNATQNFEKLTGKKVSDVIFKKDAGLTSNKIALNSNDLQPLDNSTAQKVVTAAVAKATDVDMKTIQEMQKDLASTSPFDVSKLPIPDGANVPFIPGPVTKIPVAIDPQTIFADKKMWAYIGGGALILYLITRK